MRRISRTPHRLRGLLIAGLAALLTGLIVPVADAATYTRRSEIRYGSHAGQVLDYYRPAGAVSAPIVVLIHGGWITSSRHVLETTADYLASNGVAVVNMDYRLAPLHPFPAAFDDVRSVTTWARRNAAAMGGDPNKIVLFGYSAGAHLATLAGYHDSVDVRAVVGVAGSYDLTKTREMPFSQEVIDLFMGRSDRQLGSPINLVSRGDPATLLLHGADDVLVSPAQSLRLARTLDLVGVPRLCKIYPKAEHDMFYPGNRFYRGARQDALAFITAVAR